MRAALVGLVLIPVSCSPDLREPQDVLLFFDVTCSTQSADVRQQIYEPTLQAFANELGRRDQLQYVRVSTIDHVTFLNPQWEVSARFDPYDPSEESELGHEERVTRTKDRLRQDVEVLLDESLSTPPPKCRSDVLGAFSKASATYAAPEEALSSASKHLVIFSDMLQATDELSFGRRSKVDLKDPEAVATFIEQRRSSGLLTQLTGVAVYVYAPGLNVDRGVTAEKQRLVQDFWTRYVTASGGRIATYGTEPHLP